MMPDTNPIRLDRIRPTGPFETHSQCLTVRKLDGKSLVHMDEMQIDYLETWSKAIYFHFQMCDNATHAPR